MAEKTIVTGAAGFIGSHLSEALVARGLRVVGIDSFHSNYDERIKRANLASLLGNSNFTLIEASLNDIDLGDILGDAAYLFHEAAQAGVRDSWQERFDDYIDSNIRATHRLCEAARNSNLKRFIYASSSSVYGETTQLPMSESHPTRPRSPYGVTKLSAENLCLLYADNFGVPVVALRYFTVFGPRQRPDMAFHRFMKAGLGGQPINVFGNGEQTRDFTYVSDIVDANLLAMAYDGDERVFNIGGGNRVTLNTALDILVESLRAPVDVRYNDPVEGDVMHTYADISLARAELGFTPTVGLEEGIAREVEWVEATVGELKSY